MKAKSVILSEDERKSLMELTRKHKTPQQIAIRANIILAASDGMRNSAIARKLAISRDTVITWRNRFIGSSQKDISVMDRLKDEPRPGAPATFMPEQLIHLFTIACEDPQLSGRPISHWTSRELADEMIKRSIVESISTRHVGRLLDEADLQPHRIRYWLTPEKDGKYDQKVADICNLYKTALERYLKKKRKQSVQMK